MTTTKINILVVDDLPEKLLVYRTILEELGQNLVTAGSGEEALRTRAATATSPSSCSTSTCRAWTGWRRPR